MSKRDTNKVEKMRRIVDAARIAFTTHGYEGARMDEIARAAQVAKGTLFLYVRDKQDLLFHVFHAEFEPIVFASVQRPYTGDAIGWIEQHYADIIAYNLRHLRLGGIFLKELGWLAETARGVTDNFLGTWSSGLADILRQAIDKREIRTAIDLGTLVSMLIDLLLSALRRWLSGQIDQEQMTLYLGRALRLLMEGAAETTPVGHAAAD